MRLFIEFEMRLLSGITVLFLILYLPRLIGWFGWLMPQERLHSVKKHRLALIIPARDEGKAVLPLFDSIMAQDYNRECFHTYVVVKEPNDEVIGYARSIGADVYVDESQQSKGDCLDYCFRKLLAEGIPEYDGYIIVDADCRLDKDFLSAMNDAMSNPAQVITARKLVGNYDYAGTSASNWITCMNGLIWAIIDELGNRFKSRHGLTTMTISTGILIRRELIESWGGWPYRQTLTEDMELQRDCGLRGVKTFHYSYAHICMEESPEHKVTNKRRTRWMTGMTAADRLYAGKLVRRQGMRAFRDNYYLLCLWLVYAYIGVLAFTTVVNLILGCMEVAAASFLLIYTAFFALSAMAVLSDWDNIRLSFCKKIMLMLMHPLFYMEYIYIVGRAVFGWAPKSWEKIQRVQY